MNTPALPQLPPRAHDGHKGDFGRALLVGGSRGMAGAVSLSGTAALKSGAGLVTVACPNGCLDTVAGFDRCYTTTGLPDDAGQFYEVAGSRLVKIVAEANAIGCGPGMRTGEGSKRIVTMLCEHASHVPIVFDADALNCLAAMDDWQSRLSGPVVLTPHPGEWSRLCGVAPSDRNGQTEAAIEIAKETSSVIVLKGAGTVVTDGSTTFTNKTGNAGMATGGAGDVLTGIITALLCQGLETLAAARLGAHLHGVAGDLAADQLGQPSVMATDILHFLSAAFVAHARQDTE